MQPVISEPRTGMAAQDVIDLIGAPGVRISSGLELINRSLVWQEDLSDDLKGGSVSRNSYASLHGTCTLGLSRRLDWGAAIVRPYYQMTDGVTTARFRLGAYFVAAPVHDPEESPPTYEVTGYDILEGLDDPVGDAYSVAAGEGYLARVETILMQRGYTAYIIDQEAAAKVLPVPRAWAFDDNLTWLTIINDLLAAIGYAGIWSDWDGRLRCEPYQPPRQRSPEWYYDVDIADTLLTAKRKVSYDFDRAPNRWVFYRTNDTDGPAPVEGAGMYTYINQSQGDTSVDARGDRTITRPVGLEVADQASLVARAQITIDADMTVPTTVELDIAPMPLHWHFDLITVNDPGIGPTVDALVTSWTLPLGGGNGTQSWTLLT